MQGYVAQEILGQIRIVQRVFEQHFDRNWLVSILDDLPVQQGILRDLRHLTQLRQLYPGDEHDILRGVQLLEELTAALRRHVLGSIKDRLLVSGFRDGRTIRDQNQYLLRRAVAITFPRNLEALEQATGSLRTALLSHFPQLGPAPIAPAGS